MSYIQGAQSENMLPPFNGKVQGGKTWFCQGRSTWRSQMETKLTPLLNPKPPRCSHFTIYRWCFMQVSCHVLGLIICTAPLPCWQGSKGTFMYVVLIIPNRFNICSWKLFWRLWQKWKKFRCSINRNSLYSSGERERMFLNQTRDLSQIWKRFGGWWGKTNGCIMWNTFGWTRFQLRQ